MRRPTIARSRQQAGISRCPLSLLLYKTRGFVAQVDGQESRLLPFLPLLAVTHYA